MTLRALLLIFPKGSFPMKKLWTFLGSMQFAILLLVVLILACAGGSFITQGLSYEQYAVHFSRYCPACPERQWKD